MGRVEGEGDTIWWNGITEALAKGRGVISQLVSEMAWVLLEFFKSLST